MAINDQWFLNQMKAAEGGYKAYGGAQGSYGPAGIQGPIYPAYGAQGMGYVPPPAPFGSPLQLDPGFLSALEAKLVETIINATGDVCWEKYTAQHAAETYEFRVFHPEKGEIFRVGAGPVLQAMKTGLKVPLTEIRWTRPELKPEAEPEEPLEADPFELRTW